MALSKIQAESMNLADTYAFSGTVSGTSVAGSAAFMARIEAAAWAVIGDAGILPFDNVSTGDSFDTDSVFNTTTYKFTAPATGVYMFWFSIYTSQNDTSSAFTFLKNSTKLNIQHDAQDLATYAGDNVDKTVALTCVLPLTSGNTIAVCGASTSNDYYPGHCQWGGCRLA